MSRAKVHAINVHLECTPPQEQLNAKLVTLANTRAKQEKVIVTIVDPKRIKRVATSQNVSRAQHLAMLAHIFLEGTVGQKKQRTQGLVSFVRKVNIWMK